jgi:hypothetical protein
MYKYLGLLVVLLIFAGIVVTGINCSMPETDFTGVPTEQLDCSIKFIDPENNGQGIVIGIYNYTSNGTARCDMLKMRCLIQQGELEPRWGMYSLIKYSFDCTWNEGKHQCVCIY